MNGNQLLFVRTFFFIKFDQVEIKAGIIFTETAVQFLDHSYLGKDINAHGFSVYPEYLCFVGSSIKCNRYDQGIYG